MIKKSLPGLLIGFSFVLILSLSSCNMPLEELLSSATATSLPTATQITLPTPATGVISGFVWHDLCAVPAIGEPGPEGPPQGCVAVEGGFFRANGIYDVDEPGIEGLEIALGEGDCPSTGYATATTNGEGRFSFDELASGTYCLFLDPGHPRNSQILIPGEWTAGEPEVSGVIRKVITLSEGNNETTFEFGWDHQFLPAYVPPPTDTPSPTESQEATETSTPEAGPTATPSEAATPTPTPGGTQAAQDPSLPTGDPAWKDTFDSGSNWPLYDDEHVVFEVKNGKAVMKAVNPDFYEGWMLSWPELTKFYLEGTFSTSTCAGRDRYGLMTRSTESSGAYIGYLFGVTCDGQYSLRTWDGEEFAQLISWTTSGLIETGSGKSNRLGFWAKGNQLTLYVNGNKLTEIQDSTHTNGKFGIFIGSVETDNFTVEVDEISYWNLE